MPELPEVETVRRGLEPEIRSRVVTEIKIARRDLRLPISSNFISIFQKQRVDRVDRRGKYLLLFFKDLEQVMVWHLGMSGSMLVLRGQERQKELEPHVHVVMVFDGKIEVRFRDPRRFGLLAAVDKSQISSHPLFAHLGPEPLEKGLSESYLSKILDGKKSPIKNILCDQTIVAGIGNIYACEILFRAGVSPFREGQYLSLTDIKKLISAIQTVLQEAIRAGGSSLRDHMHPNGRRGYFQKLSQVYNREGKECLKCKKSKIIRKIQSGRSTFYCSICQR